MRKKKCMKILSRIIFALDAVMIAAVLVLVCRVMKSSRENMGEEKSDISISITDNTKSADMGTELEIVDNNEGKNVIDHLTDNDELSLPEKTDPEIWITDRAEVILQFMSLDEKIYQLFIVTQEQITGAERVTRSGEVTREAIEKYPVGGIIYFANNLISREQCSSMISNIQSYSDKGLFIAVDEEGGSVARLGKNQAMGVTSFPDMKNIGDEGDTSGAYNVGYTIGTEISELGFNLDFAPIADVNSNPDNPVIGKRAFSADPTTAAAMVGSCVEGFNDSGILCTLKHFPGHGDTETDSHYGEAKTEKTLEELYECEIRPFKTGIEAGVPLVMVGHISTPNITGDDVPATLSHRIVTELLRDQLGFSGIIITDSMEMQAITDRYTSADAAVKAIQAGVDIILMPQSLSEAVEGIHNAVKDGELSEERIDESVLRILKTKIKNEIIK